MRAWMGLLLAIVTVVAASQGVLRPSSPLSARRRLLETSADYPSLKIHVTFKRKNANFHGHSEFDVYASPVLSADGISLRYDGYATFVEDKTQFTYSLVGGASYLTTKSDTERVQCLPSGALSFDSALPALNAAVSVPSASIGIESVQCARGSLYKTSYGDATFAVCASGASGFTASGLDLSIEVEYLPDAVSIPTPKLPDGSSSCDAVAMPTEVTPTSRAILTGGTLPPVSSRILKASAPMAIEAESCMCKSSPRPCVFLHGLGTSNEKTELQNTPKLTQEKFGDIGNHAPCCTTVKYAVINTVDAGWRNDTLQQKFCDFSLSMSDSSDVTTGTIADTIVVTHSMGGLVMAAALAKGKCKFAESTSWVSLSAPMMGSMAGDFIQDLCDGDYTSIY
ncbi:hypothetical protein ON010_g18228 [Phytophthora cinnamomi]|nr:hypothetical protein ON010_g18228 [Phytophthora cinnamomi]